MSARNSDRSVFKPVLICGGLMLAAGLVYFVSRPKPSASNGGGDGIVTSSPATNGSISALAATNSAIATTPPLDRGGAPLSLLDRLAKLSKDPIERQKELDLLLAQIPDAELERSLESIWDASETGAAHDLSIQLLRRWGAAMPGVASSWLAHKQAGVLRDEASLALATTWANGKTDEAAAWVRTWPEEKREAGLLAVAYEAVRKSPTNALWLAMELPATELRDQLIEHAVREWASRDSESPLTWAAQMGATPLRDQVIAGLSLAISETDPAKAAALAIETLPEGRKQEDVVVGIVQRWVQKEPEQAAEWVAQFPAGRLRETAVENLVNLWADKAIEGPAEWLGQLEGETHDSAAAAYAGKLAASSPSTAAQWVESIENQDLRDREMERLAERWLAMDAKAARVWIEKAALAQETKDRLLAK